MTNISFNIQIYPENNLSIKMCFNEKTPLFTRVSGVMSIICHTLQVALFQYLCCLL